MLALTLTLIPSPEKAVKETATAALERIRIAGQLLVQVAKENPKMPLQMARATTHKISYSHTCMTPPRRHFCTACR